jgi:hypothetical protein
MIVNCTDLLKRKRSWEPIVALPDPVVSGAEETLGRATSLRILELPVGEFIRVASKRDLPVDSVGLELLLSNVQDEIKHDKALEGLNDSWKLSTPEHNDQAKDFLSRCLELEDHPVSVARVLEVSVFFVILPIFRYLGNASSRAVSADISQDERIHVETNTRICQALNLTCSKKLDRLRREAVAWMVEGLNCSDALSESQKQYGQADFWLRQSDNLLMQGKAPELVSTRRSRVVAFFELDKRLQPTYGGT